jgi:hypothetical protein
LNRSLLQEDSPLLGSRLADLDKEIKTKEALFDKNKEKIKSRKGQASSTNPNISGPAKKGITKWEKENEELYVILENLKKEKGELIKRKNMLFNVR